MNEDWALYSWALSPFICQQLMVFFYHAKHNCTPWGAIRSLPFLYRTSFFREKESGDRLIIVLFLRA